ncbi:hypothetical protein GA0070616_4426 [Micromonospora nigra]|uniref:Uncharacterized protein n=1 Tax=Micromonospora nigra TaxID=145857 RepID=A0A1C6SRM6_9ACTN|nr:hypothetical protein [Micromonospora nigra]SCL32284.1 hypothetical protein GA0070616_4426 [Micromonospora nigra]
MSWADAGGTGTTPPAVAAGLEPGRLAAGTERRLGAAPSVARQQLLRSVRELAFELKTEQFSLLEAVRGSRLGGVTLSQTQVPVTLRITFEADGPGVRVVVLLVDRWPGRTGRNWGVTSVYVGLFESVLSTLDAVLGRLDPAAATSFAPWWRQTGPGDVAVMQHAAGLVNRAQAALSRHAGRLLDGGGQAQRQAVVTRTGGATFTFETADAVAEVPAELADGMLMVGTLIVSRPGGMPPNLVAQVQSLVFRVEEHLAANAANAAGAADRITVESSDVPAVTFLYQQARLRGVLPVRTLRTCTTCRLEKVTNPEMERLQERTRRTRDLATSISGLITPYVLAGRLVQLNSKGPDFACPRCQGMDADETVVTYCQRCGDRRAETALRTCSKCQFDFRTLVDGGQLWRPRAAASVSAPQAAGHLPPGVAAAPPLPPAAPAPPAPPLPPAAPLPPAPPVPGAAPPAVAAPAGAPPGPGWSGAQPPQPPPSGPSRRPPAERPPGYRPDPEAERWPRPPGCPP